MANPYVNIPSIIEGQQSSTQQLNTVIEATNKAGNQAVEALNYIITIPSQIVNAIHTKSGTIHTFAIAGFPLDDNNAIITKIGIRTTITASIVVGDTFTLTDGTISYTGIVPLTPNGEPYELEISTTNPLIDFTVELGGSEKHAFFKGGASLQVGEITFKDKSSDAKFLQCTGQSLPSEQYIKLQTVLKNNLAGSVWTLRNSQTGGNVLNDIAYGNGLYVAVGNYGLIVTSTDSIIWTIRTSGYSTNLQNIVFGNGKFLIIDSNARVFTTTDGTGLTQQTSFSASGGSTSLTYGNGVFIASSFHYYKTSTDGISWSSESPLSGNITGGIYANGIYLLGTANKRVYWSTSGIDNYTSATFSSASYPIGFAYGNGKFILTTHPLKCYESVHGKVWTECASQPSSTHTSTPNITYGGNYFVIGIGENAIISALGDSWTNYAIGFTARNIYSANDNFLVVGADIKIATAPNTDKITLPDLTTTYITAPYMRVL